MKKKLTALLLACFMLATLAACGGTSETESPAPAESGSPEESGSPAEVIEITIPSYKTGENVGAVFFEPQVERFNELYEGQYHITLESVPQDGFNDRLKQLAQQDMLPVLVQGGDVDWMANIAFPNGMAYDLSTWLDETPAVVS